MSFFDKKTTIVVHNSTFHSDDVFSVATLWLFLGGENKTKIIRTRDQEIISSGDIVVDVGGEYDPAKKRFDHHQIGAAGARQNGIPYAGFGLVWKEYGEKICGSKAVADAVDSFLVQIIDAGDNGISVSKNVYPGVHPYLIEHVISLFRPNWKEKNKESNDRGFLEAARFAQKVLEKEIASQIANEEAKKEVEEVYNNSEDRSIIVLDKRFPWEGVLFNFPEPMFVITPNSENGTWHVNGVRTSHFSFELRKNFPEAWAGKRDGELADVSGVSDAVFCHNARFLAVAKSREGAIELAKKALAQ